MCKRKPRQRPHHAGGRENEGGRWGSGRARGWSLGIQEFRSRPREAGCSHPDSPQAESSPWGTPARVQEHPT